MHPDFFDRLTPQRQPNPSRTETMVRRFNSEVPPGTKIRVWRGRRGEGDGHVTTVEAPGAFNLGGTAVTKCLDGGSIALTHVEILR